MFDYIVCFYFGRRRVKTTNSLLLSDRYFFVKKHLNFIKNNEKVLNDINNIVLVINNSNDEDLKLVTNINYLEVLPKFNNETFITVEV